MYLQYIPHFLFFYISLNNRNSILLPRFWVSLWKHISIGTISIRPTIGRVQNTKFSQDGCCKEFRQRTKRRVSSCTAQERKTAAEKVSQFACDIVRHNAWWLRWQGQSERQNSSVSVCCFLSLSLSLSLFCVHPTLALAEPKLSCHIGLDWTSPTGAMLGFAHWR